ncbi:isocitrate lyase/PEP mutase family protein [Saccharothrix algeriensis]|uniref:2-methylisocitrate lyase-like PEP mutase family enzyme n=1 Tax=Saccharothrix algeriensis TaxID=173560 RepID=A0A8T8HXX9_9PSEU|nr:isocitrate lyase/PEP mutase family protein [Saccharothrix algeriensis]MBM7815104.1 2-methylisocitrate lyase-like PEP mutase family enzyme [Saccharothrix algeriensis]QTR03356.1 isocitrate lyase/PEP mutase family protein [Saccharothrix algeriensis]
MAHGNALREAVGTTGTTPVIGVFDMLSATIAARHYDALFVSGLGLAASRYGLPDIGFVAWPDVVSFVQRLRLAFPRHHLLVDIDDGYVDVEVARHVVRALEQVGASGVVLEDQRRPRRCGHVAGKQVLPVAEYLAKLDAVLDARADLFVVARTDATDPAEMVERAAAFARTDADAVLVDGIPSTALLRRVAAAAAPTPLVFNQIAGGRSPALSLGELAGLGVDVAIYSTPCLFAAHRAVDDALTRLREADGRLPEDSIGVADSQSLLRHNLDVPAPRGGAVPAHD